MQYIPYIVMSIPTLQALTQSCIVLILFNGSLHVLPWYTLVVED